MGAAIGPLLRTLYPYLRDYPGAEWGGRVEPRAVATSGLQKPCLLFFTAAIINNPTQAVRNNERITLTVKLVAETMQVAVDGMARISAALKNSGAQDVDPRLPAVTGWTVQTVTEDRAVWIEESFDNARWSYHAGYQYIFLMEAN